MSATTYSVVIRSDSGGVSTAFTYNPTTKRMTAVDSRVAFTESGETPGIWTLSINGLSVAQVDTSTQEVEVSSLQMSLPNVTFPRLEFIASSLGLAQCIAAVNQSGVFYCRSIEELDSLPATGMNLLDALVMSTTGLYVSSISENLVVTGNMLTNESGQVLTDPQGNYIVIP